MPKDGRNTKRGYQEFRGFGDELHRYNGRAWLEQYLEVDGYLCELWRSEDGGVAIRWTDCSISPGAGQPKDGAVWLPADADDVEVAQAAIRNGRQERESTDDGHGDDADA